MSQKYLQTKFLTGTVKLPTLSFLLKNMESIILLSSSKVKETKIIHRWCSILVLAFIKKELICMVLVNY